MSKDTADIAVIITKEPTDAWFTTEVIVDGQVTNKGTYATKQAALRFASMQTIRLTTLEKQEKEETQNA